MDIFKSALFSLVLLGSAGALAIPVTVDMTADDQILSGGYCDDATCTDGVEWFDLGAMANADNWTLADSVTLDLDAGTHHFAWSVGNVGTPNSNNPAGLLASIAWAGGANHSSNAWEVYDLDDGSFVASATEYGFNSGADVNLWNSANGGPVAGISDLAAWIYGDDNFSATTPNNLWIRTSITIASIPEPGTLGTLALGMVALAFARRRRRR